MEEIKTEKENIFFCGGEEKPGRKGRKIFGKGKYIFAEEKKNEEGKGWKYLEKEDLPLAEENENREGKYIFLWTKKTKKDKGKNWRRKIYIFCGVEKNGE